MERESAPPSDFTLVQKVTKLREIFGINITEANTILEDCNGNLDQAVALLHASLQTARGSEYNPGGAEVAGQGYIPSTGGIVAEETGGMEVTPRSTGNGNGHTNGPGRSQASGTVNNPIDLTKEDDALQKALALSLQEMQRQQMAGGGGGEITLEDQELSRALEASLADNQSTLASMGLPTMSLFVDPLNPFERRREGGKPVGLKNVGNTCWFSAVIQSLFHIPTFRDLILSYCAPQLADGMTEVHQCVQFVQELQNLFALLLKSERKYINPQPAIQALREAFQKGPPSTGAQQDISEFTHKLLEWIEESFKLVQEGEGQEERQDNPVLCLFNGSCRTEGVLDNQPFVNESTFGAFPVQVQGRAHLHDSLEAATCSHDMQQETWFTHLPPILVLELSRFQYNQKSSQAEKLHNPLVFDRQLFLDRYLDRNKVVVRQRRREVAQLRGKMNTLQKRLLSYTHYDQKPVSISDILALALKFVHSHCSEGGREEEAEEGSSGKRRRLSDNPQPKYATLSETRTLDSCLHRWIAEVDQDMQELQESVATAQTSLDAVYSDQLMNTTCYHLHAVLVHQGQASGGHYWAYVKKPCQRPQGGQGSRSHDSSPNAVGDVELESQSESEVELTSPQTGQTGSASETETQTQYIVTEPDSDQSPPVSETHREATDYGKAGQTSLTGDKSRLSHSNEEVWLKFNDVSVSEVKWEEVQRESYGGERQNTSAYCLLYISTDLRQQGAAGGQAEVKLSQGLQGYVEEDNLSFRSEMEEYEQKQQQKQQQSEKEDSASGHVSEDKVEAAAQAGDARRAELQQDTSPEHMQVDTTALPPVDAQLVALLNKKVAEEHMKMLNMGRGKVIETRLLHPIIYAILSEAEDNLVRILLLEEISTHCERNDLRFLAKKETVALLSQPGMQHELNRLRALYRMFCDTCYHCVKAALAVKQQSWQQALLHSVYAFSLNHDIHSESDTQFGVPVWVVGELRREALRGASSMSKKVFEGGQVHESLSVAHSLLVPALKEFSLRACEGDEEGLERVREQWCQCLMHPSLNKAEQEQLAELLTQMFDDVVKASSLPHPPTPEVDPRSLAIEYSNATLHIYEERHTALTS